MKDHIKKHTKIIIRKNGEYLVGRILGSRDLRWSPYRSDAVGTRDENVAREAARKTGGVMMLYNDVTGECRLMTGG